MTAADRARTARREADGIRHQQLLAAAAECFDEVGYSATTVEMIASRAQTSRPTFYAYFPSKEAIFLATVTRVGESLVEAQSVRGMSGLAPGEVLARTTRRYIETIFDHGGLVGLIDSVAAVNPEVAELWDGAVTTTVDRMARFVEATGPEYIDPAVPADRLVRVIADGIHYGAMRLGRATPAEKERFITDHIAIIDRLVGIREPD